MVFEQFEHRAKKNRIAFLELFFVTLSYIHAIVTYMPMPLYFYRCLKKVIHHIDRKRTVAPFSKFYGKIWAGFELP